MIIRGVTQGPTHIFAAARSVGVEAEVKGINAKGTSYRFTLKLGPAKVYQRTSPTMTNKSGDPRRINAVCWHGHAAFFKALFALEPSAVVSSARMGQVRYTADNFERVYPATGDWNIGSMYAPCAFRDACDYDSHPINQK